MSIIQNHLGGSNPWINANNGAAVGQGLPTCDRRRDPTIHNNYPYKLLINRFNQDELGGGGCICIDCTPLAIGDVITLIELGGGKSLREVQWDVKQADPTFEFDLEIRKVSDLTAPGVVVQDGLGTAQADGAKAFDIYFSKYGVPCAGKDCYGQTVNGRGYDHAMLVAVVKALPTGSAAGCKANCAPMGLTQMDVFAAVSDFK